MFAFWILWWFLVGGVFPETSDDTCTVLVDGLEAAVTVAKPVCITIVGWDHLIYYNVNKTSNHGVLYVEHSVCETQDHPDLKFAIVGHKSQNFKSSPLLFELSESCNLSEYTIMRVTFTTDSDKPVEFLLENLLPPGNASISTEYIERTILYRLEKYINIGTILYCFVTVLITMFLFLLFILVKFAYYVSMKHKRDKPRNFELAHIQRANRTSKYCATNNIDNV